MDDDEPELLSFDSLDPRRQPSYDNNDNQAPGPVSPLPANRVQLPSFPRPSLSPSSSKTFVRTLSSRTSSGLDLGMSSNRYQPRFAGGATSPVDGEFSGSPRAASPMERSERSRLQEGGESMGSLEEEVQRTRRARRARTERQSSRTITHDAIKATVAAPAPSPASHLPSNSSTSRQASDVRDTASARENIFALASARKPSTGSAPSLASFMGGGSKPPPLHRVGTGPTQDEQEGTAKLEEEMEARKAKWGNKEDVAPVRGPSLASLMKGRAQTDQPSPVEQRVAQKWGASKTSSVPATYGSTSIVPQSPSNSINPPSRDYVPSSTVTPSRPTYSTSPASSFTGAPFTSTPSNPSLASALGSKASGPRLNTPAAQPTVEEGPAHARSRGAVAMPGMVPVGIVRERTRSLTGATLPIIEAKVLSRTAPADDVPLPIVAPSFSEPPRTYGLPQSSIPTTTSSSAPAFQKPATSASMAATNFLTRLQSNIVSERLKQSEAQVAATNTPTKTPTAEKRRSVLERWGRDEPNSTPSSPVVGASKLPWGEKSEERDAKVLTGIRGGEFSKGLAKLPVSGGPTVLVDAAIEQSAAPGRIPRRTLPSASSSLAPSLVPSSPTKISSAPVFYHAESSPQVDSPSIEGSLGGEAPESKEPSAAPERSRGWTGPPIGVREGRKPATEEEEPVAAVKRVPGVALPGMSRSAPPPSSDPTMSRLIASQYETSRGLKDVQSLPRYDEPERPTAMEMANSLSNASPSKPIPFPVDTYPWSTAKSSSTRPTSFCGPSTPLATPRPITISAAQRLASLELDNRPCSPGGSVRNAIASWGTPTRSDANTTSVKESYGVKVPSRKASFEIKPTALVEDPTPPAKRTADETFPSTPKAAKAATTSDEGFKTPTTRSRRGSANRLPTGQVAKLIRKASTPSLTSGKPVSIEIFSITSDSSEPIDLTDGTFYEAELLAIVHRTKASGLATTQVFVWRGREAVVDAASSERVEKLAQQHGTKAIEIQQGHETRELMELVGGELVTRQGSRQSFDKHNVQLYSVRSDAAGVFITEASVSPSSLCSGFCSVLSLMGDVFVWLGKGSFEAERKPAIAFAGKLADGREVTVLDEGFETEFFWVSLNALDSSNDIASAHYWRFRPTHRHQLAVLAVDSTSRPKVSRVDSLIVPDSCISVVDGGFELWIICPQGQENNRDSLAVALDASEELAKLWKSRNLPYRPPQHVLLFPTAIPRDVPHLARQLDLARLNAGATPTEMNLYTSLEARSTLL